MLLLERLKASRYMQYVATLIVSFGPLSASTFLTWPSPSLPLLTSKDSPIGVTLTDEEASWVVASLSLGMLPAGIIQGILLDLLGPKGTLLTNSIILFVPWIFLGFAKSLTLLIIGRFIGGIGLGIVLTCTPLYICEIASNDIRGKLGAMPSFTIILGSLVVLGIGPFIEYVTLIIICGCFPPILFLSVLFMPDSPYYLLKKGKEREARRSLTTFSSISTNIEEIDANLKAIKETLECDTNQVTLIQLFTAPNFRKSVLIVLGAKTIMEFSGVYTINSYVQTIIESSNSSLSPQLSSVVYSVVQIPAVILAGLLVDKLGRKKIFAISSFGGCIAMIGEGTYFYLQGKVNLNSVSFLPVFFLTIYKLLISFGINYLPYFIIGEFFPPSTKKIGGLIFAIYAGVINFIDLKLFVTVTNAWGIYTVCWFFSGVCALGIVFGLFLMPETKGKSLDDIQKSLSS